MKNKFLQKVVDTFSGLITKIVKSELPKASKALDTVVKNLNAEIKNEGPLSFLVPAFGLGNSINLTMTQAPDLSTQDQVRIFFDGLIEHDNSTYTNTEGIVTPQRL